MLLFDFSDFRICCACIILMMFLGCFLRMIFTLKERRTFKGFFVCVLFFLMQWLNKFSPTEMCSRQSKTKMNKTHLRTHSSLHSVVMMDLTEEMLHICSYCLVRCGISQRVCQLKEKNDSCWRDDFSARLCILSYHDALCNLI